LTHLISGTTKRLVENTAISPRKGLFRYPLEIIDIRSHVSSILFKLENDQWYSIKEDGTGLLEDISFLAGPVQGSVSPDGLLRVIADGITIEVCRNSNNSGDHPLPFKGEQPIWITTPIKMQR
jgi:hypothetical protein